MCGVGVLGVLRLISSILMWWVVVMFEGGLRLKCMGKNVFGVWDWMVFNYSGLFYVVWLIVVVSGVVV